eukprot:TRINITY_DN67636_c8_g10_i1.p1 TRINITY_DN67636_c8_g10~~TRINITY_DN67636_c8_g10_i1.p1  ORF type:complete len:387 (-),score=22.55 TRINITY_DN67636_c8_g10_i1:148-1191(-)
MKTPNASDSMLSVWLSGEWEDFWAVEEQPEDGLIFLDRDGLTFQTGILDWLRDGEEHVLFKSRKFSARPAVEAESEDPLANIGGPVQTVGKGLLEVRSLLAQVSAALNGMIPQSVPEDAGDIVDVLTEPLLDSSAFIWRHHKEEWVHNLLREAEYFGLSQLVDWCSHTLSDCRRLPLMVVDHYQVTMNRGTTNKWVDRAVADNPQFNLGSYPAPGYLNMVGLHRCIPSTSNAAFFVHVLESANFLLGFRCRCSLTTDGTDNSPFPTFKAQTCNWYVSELFRVYGVEDGVVGAHLKDSTIYWTCSNRQPNIIAGPTPLPCRTEAGERHYLVPVITLMAGKIRTTVEEG